VNHLLQELLELHEELTSFIDSSTAPAVLSTLDTLEDTANEIGRAWNKSWIGYQANIYYKDLQPSPPGSHFDSEWGFIDSRTSGTYGDWIEVDPYHVRDNILKKVLESDLKDAANLAAKSQQLFIEKRDQIHSILEAIKLEHNDPFFEDLLDQTKNLQILSEQIFLENIRPNQIVTRDSLALSQGLWTPPHIAMLAKFAALRSPIDKITSLATIAKKASTHIERVNKENLKDQKTGSKVFIGHGQSTLWKDLKDFIQNRLKLQWEEFNRVSVAGNTIVDRLSEMLDNASMAFLVMTAEDEQPNGKSRARMNVIHEVGLFQGRLGFTKAIILLEEGCEEFSNIHGLVQIRFPKGDIAARFEDIRLVLEREGLLKT